MTKLYKKSELAFAIVMIVIYCITQSATNQLNELIGIKYLAHGVFSAVMSIILLLWIWKRGLLEKYKFRKPDVKAGRFLWYIPLLILISHNLWNGIAINFSLADGICYMCLMLFVGILEELLFRALLFEAIARGNPQTAIIVTSATFGLGHLINLINGVGMDLLSNICQVVGAIAIGFLFVMIYYRGGSIIPCIVTHSGIDMASTFANDNMTAQTHILFSLSRLVIVVIYTLILNKTLPKKTDG